MIDSMLDNSKLSRCYDGPKGGLGMLGMQSTLAELSGQDMTGEAVFLAKGRFSGGTRGLCFGHRGLGTAVGGPIAPMKDGIMISTDAGISTLSVEPDEAELKRRKTEWKLVDNNYKTDPQRKHAWQAGPACISWGSKTKESWYADI